MYWSSELDTAYPQPNLRLLNDLGSPRSLNHGKFSEAVMDRKIPLPRGWKRRVKSSILHILALSHYTFTAMVARASNDRNRRTRRRAEIDRLNHELALLREELRIKNARMQRVPPHRRPHYTPLERMAILELRAARGWSARQTAERLLITPTTVAA